MSELESTLVQRLRFAANSDYLDTEQRYKRLCKEAADEVERLDSESSELAAAQCHDGYGDEYANWRCKYQDKISSLKKALTLIKNELEDDITNGTIALVTARKALGRD